MSAPAPFVLNNEVNTANSHVVRIRGGISDKPTLLREVGLALRFPYYDTPNWDGFNDWISDLSWIQSRNIAILHTGAPQVSRKDLLIYLEILCEAVESLRRDGRELVVSFPEWTRALADAWSGAKPRR